MLMTVVGRHVVLLGDTIYIESGVSRYQRLRSFLARPRVMYVSAIVSAKQFETSERRMTWREWRVALGRMLFN